MLKPLQSHKVHVHQRYNQTTKPSLPAVTPDGV